MTLMRLPEQSPVCASPREEDRRASVCCCRPYRNGDCLSSGSSELVLLPWWPI